MDCVTCDEVRAGSLRGEVHDRLELLREVLLTIEAACAPMGEDLRYSLLDTLGGVAEKAAEPAEALSHLRQGVREAPWPCGTFAPKHGPGPDAVEYIASLRDDGDRDDDDGALEAEIYLRDVVVGLQRDLDTAMSGLWAQQDLSDLFSKEIVKLCGPMSQHERNVRLEVLLDGAEAYIATRDPEKACRIINYCMGNDTPGFVVGAKCNWRRDPGNPNFHPAAEA